MIRPSRAFRCCQSRGAISRAPSLPLPAREISAAGAWYWLPGYLTRESDGTVQSTAIEIENGRIKAIYIMRNPDKLRHLDF